MHKKVIIIGASGHGKVIADIIQRSGDEVLGFLDDNPAAPSTICGLPLLGKVADYDRFADAYFVIGIGGSAIRSRISEMMHGVRWYTAIHPDATISDMETSIDEGTVVMAGAVVNPCARIGKHCIINTGAIVEHDNRIGDYVHVSVGAKLAGTVNVGDKSWIGIGATVSNNCSICENCFIGAGAVIVRDIEMPGTYVGVPARRIK